MNVEIRTVNEETDRVAILALLEKFYPVKKHWEKLFIKRMWTATDSISGYIICDHEQIVGYLGLIFSELTLDNQQKHTICNLTTWYVEPAYRQYSLRLLQKVFDSKQSLTWTNLSPSASAYQLFLRYGFKPFTTHQYLILPLGGAGKNLQILFNEQVVAFLDEKNKQIYLEHQGLNCTHVFIQDKKQQISCYFILIKTEYKKLFVGKIYYVNNKNNFSLLLKRARLKLCFYLRICYLLVEENCLIKQKTFGVFSKKLTQPRLFKSDFLTADQVPLLCSELMVLGI